jgi:hypothetical protein
MSETVSLLPSASAFPPTSVDAALVAAAAAQATPAQAPANAAANAAQPASQAAAAPAVTAAVDPLPMPATAMTALARLVTAHVHAAPAARASSILATIEGALESAVAIHTQAVTSAMAAAAPPSEARIVVSAIGAEIGKLETSADAEVKSLTGIVLPKWVIGIAALLFGGAAGALLVRFIL